MEQSCPRRAVENSPARLSTAEASALAFLTAGDDPGAADPDSPDRLGQAPQQLRLPGDFPHHAGFRDFGCCPHRSCSGACRAAFAETMLLSAACSPCRRWWRPPCSLPRPPIPRRCSRARPWCGRSCSYRPTPCCSPSPSPSPDSCWARLLSDERLPTRQIYFFDLLGRALGALVVLPLFRYVNVETMIVGFSLAPGGRESPSWRGRRGQAAAMAQRPHLRPASRWCFRGRTRSSPSTTPRARCWRRPGTQPPGPCWNTRNGILWRASRYPRFAAARPTTGVYASLFGENRDFLRRYRKLITQNNFAFTYGGRLRRPPRIAGRASRRRSTRRPTMRLRSRSPRSR